MKQKNRKGGFLSMLSGTLDASLLGNLLTGKGVKRSKISGGGVEGAVEGAIRTDQDF